MRIGGGTHPDRFVLELLVPAGGMAGSVNVEVDRAWLQRHGPETGGYLVVYPDDYKSFSPAKAFEEGYVLIESDAKGTFVTRKLSAAQIEQLNGAGIDFELQPDGLAKVYVEEPNLHELVDGAPVGG